MKKKNLIKKKEKKSMLVMFEKVHYHNRKINMASNNVYCYFFFRLYSGVFENFTFLYFPIYVDYECNVKKDTRLRSFRKSFALLKFQIVKAN